LCHCICLRDEDVYVLAKTMSLSLKHTIEVIEALGLFYALQWLVDMQFDNVEFLVDSKITIDAFNSNRQDVTKFGHIITTCQFFFSSYFTNSRVEFNRRQTNMIVHALAGYATLSASPTIHSDVPDCMNNIIINEML